MKLIEFFLHNIPYWYFVLSAWELGSLHS